ncbi:MAG: hypothetical protein MZV63_26555 [Marinilabiliales bacterium]|nr:hypothetical protein [Marinilabiliales bacterium]
MLTFWLTLGSVVINTVFGTMLSFILVRHSFRGKVFLEGIIDLPFAVSPVIAGFMFIILFGPRGWIGSGWFDAQNIKIIYAFPGMLLATLFVTFPFVVREIGSVREYGIDQEEAAYVLGASRVADFLEGDPALHQVGYDLRHHPDHGTGHRRVRSGDRVWSAGHHQ